MPKNPATSILNNIQEFKKNSENSSLEKENSLVLKNSMVLNINNYIYGEDRKVNGKTLWII